MLPSNGVNLSRCPTNLIHVSKNLPLAFLIASRANILCKFLIFIFFNFGRGFCGSFPRLFSEAPASYDIHKILK